jgi:predicted 3-demethylubiquinone-9 3-methyltransferase (glyoxalase superfamily)
METNTSVQRIAPFLWFDGKVGEAVQFYTSVFKNSKIISMNRLGEKIMTATFVLNGMEFMALDGGPMYKFSPATSFFVKCTTQEEVDELWDKLSEGGKKSRCGWLDDKFGVTWQIIPDALGQLMYASNPAKSKNVMAAMMRMDKIIIKDLQEAYDRE